MTNNPVSTDRSQNPFKPASPGLACRWRRRLGQAVLPTVMALLAPAVLASGYSNKGRQMPAQVPAAYQQECASCHLAYPPGLLPARSWDRLMGHLEQHFGSDASLDPATAQQIGAWLQSNAGTYKRVSESPPEDRITRSVWFARKHDDIAPSVWPLPSVKSAANCAACHSGAEQGRFDDDHLKFPAGLDARSRRAWND